ncbi:hypothetical protein [Fluviispira multicolorata]|uniref:Iron-containing redox enzyme n=1 Tax=Fluviispira multicolorata TaxID=2654512 RepID=A0A833N7F1_9BACT|nr:hypothetical protein [Fluviispira multicolorata]KAB8032110.1 hypothetical protein GCL57_05540 [Fluviispira multicolorata]
MNRCKNIGLPRKKLFLSLEDSKLLRVEIDNYIDGKIEEFNQNIPFAEHFKREESLHLGYYKRFLIETVLRIRLLRVVESKALVEITKISPEAAQVWANYEMEEMIHDELFMSDLEQLGVNKKDIFKIEPYLSTKLLSGYFNYLLDHEGPLGVVIYSYLVEYVNVKLDPKKIESLRNKLTEKQLKGYNSHSKTDIFDDHPGEVWKTIRYLIKDEIDIKNIYKYIDENQSILGMFFKEIYSETIERRSL